MEVVYHFKAKGKTKLKKQCPTILDSPPPHAPLKHELLKVKCNIGKSRFEFIDACFLLDVHDYPNTCSKERVKLTSDFDILPSIDTLVCNLYI